MDFVDIIAFLVVAVAWLLRLVTAPMRKKQKEEARRQRQERSRTAQQTPREASQLPQQPQRSRQAEDPRGWRDAGNRGAAREQGKDLERSAFELLRELGLDLESEPERPPPKREARPAPPREVRAPAAPTPAWKAEAPPPRRLSEGVPGVLPPPPRVTAPPAPVISAATPGRVPITDTEIAGGTVVVAPRPLAQGLREQLLDDLHGGAASLARAMVLAEILGQPPGLRAPGEPPRW